VLTSLDAADFSAAGGGDRASMDRAFHVVHQRLVLSSGTVLIPVLSGRLWWGIVLRSINHMVQVVVEAERHGRELVGAADRDPALVVVNTSSEGKNAGGWDERVVDRLFLVLATAICRTILRTSNSPVTLSRVAETLRRGAPVVVVEMNRGEPHDSAERLLAFFTLLQSATPGAAGALLRNPCGRGWGQTHASRRLRGLVRLVVDPHRSGKDTFDEDESAEELMNGRDLSEYEMESAHTMTYHDSEDGKEGARDGLDERRRGGSRGSGGGTESQAGGSARGSVCVCRDRRRQEGSSRSNSGGGRRRAMDQQDGADHALLLSDVVAAVQRHFGHGGGAHGDDDADARARRARRESDLGAQDEGEGGHEGRHQGEARSGARGGSGAGPDVRAAADGAICGNVGVANDGCAAGQSQGGDRSSADGDNDADVRAFRARRDRARGGHDGRDGGRESWHHGGAHAGARGDGVAGPNVGPVGVGARIDQARDEQVGPNDGQQ